MTPAEIAARAADLRAYATENDNRILDAIETEGTIGRAAASLGVSRSSVRTNLRNLQKRAAVRGWSPDHDMTKAVPEPFVVRGTSTLYNHEGKPKLQWVKTRLDDERRHQIMLEAAQAMAETLPRVPPVPRPAETTAALCNVHTFTDCHLGMLAWRHETGADWDLKIAERTLIAAFDEMLLRAPAAGTCVIAQLGDLLHSDGLLPVTPTSGHVLDQDGRFSKIVAAAIRVLRTIVDGALARHDRVVVLLAEGNHDMASSVWLRAMFAALYENEPRIEVVDTPLPYYAVQHGQVMLAFHHGHLKKPDGLPLLLAAQFPQMWGGTTKRYAHTGHLHHVAEKEFSGMKVVQHPTLAARDAYAARGGWISERQAACITYHAEHGEVARTIVTPEMLK